MSAVEQLVKIRQRVTDLLWQAVIEASKLSEEDQNDIASIIREKAETSLSTLPMSAEAEFVLEQPSLENENGVNTQVSKQSGTEFLLSVAGIFDAGVTDTSENVEAIVTSFILKKHGQASSGFAD